jgi:hypothetical protein
MIMSFGRLLAAGKSWVGGDGIGRYRMQKHIRLPKFISPQNPFKRETEAEVDTETPVLPAVTPGANGPAERATIAANQVSWWVRLGAGLRRFARWCLDRNLFGRLGRPALTAIPRFGRTGDQGELSLDTVKVLRGDLTHADLEVIPVGAGRNQAASPAWKNLATRMFGAGLK